MKTALSLLLTAFIALACDESRHYVAPSDQFYKRWKSVEIGKNGKDWRELTPQEVVEFVADGTVLYENRSMTCCSPVQLDRQKKILKVVKIGTTGPCANVSCVAVSELHILSLSDTELVLDFWNSAGSAFSIRYEATP
ncbi:hypothetical protein [Larkinella rosea]|uniref:Lipoprotein n=1 Tax=Larkinella rosea TaxID=2025312 RepID=A0A3P1BNH1_9BACT|nr:hypothetical protein [Larkinella rosea]RRB02356.1 hypothetical protein EHT25_17960 [Larkinella rosea]